MSAYLTYLRNCILHCLSCEDFSGMLILIQGILREYSNERVGANTGESTHLDNSFSGSLNSPSNWSE